MGHNFYFDADALRHSLMEARKNLAFIEGYARSVSDTCKAFPQESEAHFAALSMKARQTLDQLDGIQRAHDQRTRQEVGP